MIDFDVHDYDEAQKYRAECYAEFVAEYRTPLLSRSSATTKLRKSEREGLVLVSLALAHARTSGHNVCPQSTAECRQLCVSETGLSAVFPKTIAAGRIRKVKHLFSDRTSFLRQLTGELEQVVRRSRGRQVYCRLNQFSDLPWETPAFGCMPQLFPEIQFYDWSKIQSRCLSPHLPANYRLTFSWSGHNEERCYQVLTAGRNVSIPFATDEGGTGRYAYRQILPERWSILGTSFHVIDGDRSDIRSLDPYCDDRGFGRIVGLRFKSATNANREYGLSKSRFIVKH